MGSPNAIINASVHVDADTDGTLSDGDWISDSIVPVVSNSKMSATISIVEVGTDSLKRSAELLRLCRRFSSLS